MVDVLVHRFVLPNGTDSCWKVVIVVGLSDYTLSWVKIKLPLLFFFKLFVVLTMPDSLLRHFVCQVVFAFDAVVGVEGVRISWTELVGVNGAPSKVGIFRQSNMIFQWDAFIPS